MKYSGCFVMNTCFKKTINPRFINMEEYRYFQVQLKTDLFISKTSKASTRAEFCNVTQLIDDKGSYQKDVSNLFLKTLCLRKS